MIEMGPILSLQEASSSTWRLSAVVVSEQAPPALVIEGADAVAEELWRVGQRSAWRYRFDVELREAGRSVRYSVGDMTFSIAVPGAGLPPRIAYASCNGFSSVKDMKRIEDKNALWKKMGREHAAAPYNLLLMGGDQVYADSIWEVLPEMRAWAASDFDEANRAKPSPDLPRVLQEFYFDLYASRWAQPEVRKMLASIPTIMMWDDHDIIDGWGSYPPARQNSAVYVEIWKAARRAFKVFQQQLQEGEHASRMISPGHGFSLGHVVGTTAIIALDMRSERRLDQVLSPPHWNEVYQWVESLENIDHLLIMSSIPVVYPGFDLLERILGIWPGQNELEDDLADHWTSRPHKGERLRLIHRLLRLTEQEIVRPTLLSGDVHVAALGYVESSRSGAARGTVINQLISSGIVHPGPPGAVVFALRHLFDSTDEIDRGIVGRMAELPGSQTRCVGKRNYLALEPDTGKAADYRLWVKWWVEGEDDAYVKVIHPLTRKTGPEVVPQAAAAA